MTRAGAWPLAAALALACGAKPEAEATADSGAALPEPCVDCVLSDAQNYRYTAELSVDVVPGSAEVTPVVDWSALRHDLHGHRVGADFDVEEALLLVFLELGPEEVQAALGSDTLQQADVSLFATCTSPDARCGIGDFTAMGRDVDLEQYYLDGYGTWMVLLRSSFEAGAHAMVFLPPASGGAEEIRIGDDSSKLDVAVDFRSSEPLVVGGSDAVTLDWSGLTQDGLGNPLAVHQIDRLMLARYDAPLSTLETQVFDLERVADERFDLAVSGRSSATLAELDGPRPLTDLSAPGTWLLALSCSVCANPAPKFVARVVGTDP